MTKILLLLSLAGTVFSGYLSSVKLFSKTCAFGETCPIFLGYPACYYGFVLFLLLTIFSGILIWGSTPARKTLTLLVFVSILGVLFAGYYTIVELPVLFSVGFSAYVLGLPTCALGLIFFVAVLAIALSLRKRVVV